MSRFVHPAPPVLHRQVHRSDLALHALHREMAEPGIFERVIAPVVVGVLAVVSFALVASS